MPSALVLVAPGCEEMESVIIIDVLRRAEVDTIVAGVTGKEVVTCSRGVVLTPDGALSDFLAREFDAVVLPGGLKGAEAFANSAEVGAVLRTQQADGRIVAAICASPGIALTAHTIGGMKRITCHPSVKDRILASNAGYKYEDTRVVTDGNLITSQGPGTALEFAIEVARAVAGEEKAQAVQKQMMMV